MADAFYNIARKALFEGTLDLDNDTLMVMLIDTATYTFDAGDDYVDDGTANDPASAELTGGGYARQTLAGKTVTEPDSTKARFDATTDTTFASLGPCTPGTADAAILFKDSGSDGENMLIAYFDTEFPIVTNGSDVVIEWNASGLFELS